MGRRAQLRARRHRRAPVLASWRLGSHGSRDLRLESDRPALAEKFFSLSASRRSMVREHSRLLLGPQTVPKKALQTPSRASRPPVPPGPGMLPSLPLGSHFPPSPECYMTATASPAPWRREGTCPRSHSEMGMEPRVGASSSEIPAVLADLQTLLSGLKVCLEVLAVHRFLFLCNPKSPPTSRALNPQTPTSPSPSSVTQACVSLPRNVPHPPLSSRFAASACTIPAAAASILQIIKHHLSTGDFVKKNIVKRGTRRQSTGNF